MEFFAHSGRPGIPPQSYSTHITNVRIRAEANLRAALKYAPKKAASLLLPACWAATYHDLGKLEEENQQSIENLTARAITSQPCGCGSCVPFILSRD
jgi:hypothetical protein